MKNSYQQFSFNHHEPAINNSTTTTTTIIIKPNNIQSTLLQSQSKSTISTSHKKSNCNDVDYSDGNCNNKGNCNVVTELVQEINLGLQLTPALRIMKKLIRLLAFIISSIITMMSKQSKIGIIIFTLLIGILINQCDAGCRGEPADACESICTSNPYTDPNANCTIRALVLAPNSTFYEASLPKILPILQIAEERVKTLQLLPPQVKFSWISRNDRCDAGYALVGAMDGIAKNCSHVIFGPPCDYPLASVGRVAKYFHSEGTPILSVGGFTYDFQETKTSCKDEFYMLIRTGILSFQSISELIVAIMKNYHWQHTLLMYRRDGQRNVAGLHTCQLMMKTLVETYKHLNVTYSPFDLDSGAKNLTEDLQAQIGTKHSSKYNNHIFILFYYIDYISLKQKNSE